MAIDIKKLSSRIISLDDEHDKIIALSYRGKDHLLTRSDIEELLWIKERSTAPGARVGTSGRPNEWEVLAAPKRSGFFSLGKLLGFVLDAGKLTPRDIGRLDTALEELLAANVEMNATRTSQVGHMITALRKVPKLRIPTDLDNKFELLLDKYPELLHIPEKLKKMAR